MSSSSAFVALGSFQSLDQFSISQHTNMTLTGHHQVQHEVLKNTSLQHVPSDHGLFICAHICKASRRKFHSSKLQRLARQSSNKHKFVLLVLLKSHKRFGDALRILVQREDAPGSLHRLQVSCFLEEFHQHILVDVLKDVRRRFLAVRRVEFDAAHCGTDATRVWRRVWRHGGRKDSFRDVLCLVAAVVLSVTPALTITAGFIEDWLTEREFPFEATSYSTRLVNAQL